MKSRNPLVIEVMRGPLVESAHQVIFCVASNKGHIVDYHGNVDYVVPPRSSIKMLQSIPLLETGAAEAFKLKDQHIALACASHKAQKHHLTSLSEWLEVLGKTESVLRCGPSEPTKTALSHNCSGKHLGFVTTALHLKINPENYNEFTHPIQELQRKVMTDILGLDFSKIPHGGDGCGIPTYGIPIQKLALAMAHLVREDLPEARRKTVTRILDAIRKYPEYLSGDNDAVFKLISTTQGRAIMKTGAEGVYTGLMPDKGYAFAVKAVDGSHRAAEMASFFLFKHYGAMTANEAEGLKEFISPPILDSRGQKVGIMRIQLGSV